MRFYFIANSAWYLKNFRSSTIKEFANIREVVCLYPYVDDGSLVRQLKVSAKPFYMDAVSINPVKEIMSLVSLFWRLLWGRPSICFSFNPKTNLYTLIACWLLHIPCVPNISGMGVASQFEGVVGGLYKVLAKFFYRRASHVFFQNEDDYNSFIKTGWVKPDRAEVIPGSGVNLSQFKPYDKSCGRVRFLMAARLIVPKGVLEYLEAARQVLAGGLECEFVLAGVRDTSKRAISDSVITALEDEPRIHFAGHVEDMPELLNTIDCVVLPSYYPEGIPRSLIEAAAAGKIIITTDTPGCREVVIEGVNGYLVPPQSIVGLATRMQHVINMPAENRKAMQQASRTLAESRFDEKIVIQRYLDIVERLTGLSPS